MTTYYLRNFVESVSELPSELARKFKLMRELDEKAHGLQAEAEAASRRRLEEAAQQACCLSEACERAIQRPSGFCDVHIHYLEAECSLCSLW